MSTQDWRYFVYRSSDIIKRPLGAYCARLFREGVGDNEYLIALKKTYRQTNTIKLGATTLDDLLEEADTRGWFKLIRQNLDGRLRMFVPRRKRNAAGNYLGILIREYNDAYHQQDFDQIRARETVKTTLAFLHLTDPPKTGLKEACQALEKLMLELNAPSGLSEFRSSEIVITPPTVPQVPERSVIMVEPPLSPDAQVTAPIQPDGFFTLQAIMADGVVIEKPLSGYECLVGRSSQAHFQLDDPKVSRIHLKLSLLPGQITVTDNGSTHGTFMNDQRLPGGQPVPFRVGQRLVVGDTMLILKWNLGRGFMPD